LRDQRTDAASGRDVTVDGKTNGGISIKGWERNESWFGKDLKTRAPHKPEADQWPEPVRIETAGAEHSR